MDPQSERSVEAGNAKLRVFLSYSRKDKDFITKLADALTRRGYLADFDQTTYRSETGETGIAPTDDWWMRLRDMIAAADVMVLAVSPDSAASKVVDEEIAYARSLSKRIISVTCREVDFNAAPPRLSALNVNHWFLTQEFEAACAQLTNALDRDVEWLRKSSNYTIEAKAWSDANRQPDRLLFGEEIASAEGWSARRPYSAPQVSELVLEFIAASRSAQTQREKQQRRAIVRTRWLQRWIGVAVAAAFAITVAGAWFVIRGQRNLAHSQSMSLAASAEEMRANGDPVRGLRLAVLAGHQSFLTPVSEQAQIQIASNAQASNLIANFVGHTGEVTGATFSPDESRLLTWSKDGSARLWDMSSGRPIGMEMKSKEEDAGDEIVSAVFSEDGSKILTTTYAAARLWDSGTGDQIGKSMYDEGENGRGKCVTGADFSSGGANVVRWNCLRLSIFDANSNSLIRSIATDSGRGATLSADKTRLLTRSLVSGKLAQWDTATGLQVGKDMAHAVGRTYSDPVWNQFSDWVSGAAYSANRKTILSWGRDGFVRGWWADSGEPLERVFDNETPVMGAVLNSPQTMLATWGTDFNARLWAFNGAPAKILKDAGPLNGAAFDDAMRGLLTWNSNGSAQQWDVETAQRRGDSLVHAAAIEGAAYGSDNTIVTWSEDATARRWERYNGQPLGIIARGDAPIKGAAITRDRTRIVTWGADGVRLWSTALSISAPTFTMPAGTISNLVSAHSGAYFATIDDKGLGQVWSAKTGKPIGGLIQQGAPLRSIEWTDDDTRLVSFSVAGAVAIWNPTSGVDLKPVGKLAEEVSAGAVLVMGGAKLLAVSGSRARLWDTVSGQPVGDGVDLGAVITRAVASRDGRRVVVWNGRLYSIDAQSGEVTGGKAYGEASDTPVFSWDGEHVLMASGTKLKQWSISSMTPAGPSIETRSNILEVLSFSSFSTDGALVSVYGRQWSTQTGKPIGPDLNERKSAPQGVYSPNSLYFASWDRFGRSLVLWDARTGVQRTNDLSKAQITGAVFSSDSLRLLAWDREGVVRIFDVGTGAQLGTEMPHDKTYVAGAHFVNGSGGVVSWNSTGARQWDISWATRLAPLQAFMREACERKLKGASRIDAGDVAVAPILRGREGEDVCAWRAPWYDGVLEVAAGWTFGRDGQPHKVTTSLVGQ